MQIDAIKKANYKSASKNDKMMTHILYPECDDYVFQFEFTFEFYPTNVECIPPKC